MMNTVHRRLGKARTADESQIAVLLREFDDADTMLQKLTEAAKTWRDSWRDILVYQERFFAEFHGLYKPIMGAGADHVAMHEPVETPQENVERVAKLHSAYAELKEEMLDELNLVDTRIIKPAMDARESIQPLKKVIKRRQDRKIDFERAHSKHETNTRKTNRTDRDKLTFARSESELAITKQEYELSDEKLKTNLPPLIAAAFSLLPELLTSQIMVQNSLLGNYYTHLHNYCEEEGFPSPPPPMTDIISVWQGDFQPLQQQVESRFACIAGGKAIKLPMRQSETSLPALRTTTSNGIDGNGRIGGRGVSPRPAVSPARSDNSIPPSPNLSNKPAPTPEADYNTRISNLPSQGTLALATPNYSAGDASPANEYLTPHAPAGPRADYFSRDRNPSTHLAAAAAQKKRPPPPPPKRNASAQTLWVTALYDFAGQGQGDLAFREGDRIKVIKKTESTDDWWEGELGGVKGPFPANYCKT